MSDKKYDDPDDDPEVIIAKAEAEARIPEARAKLHPASQFFLTVIESVGNLFTGIGCLVIIAIAVVAIFAPQLFDLLFKH